MRADSERRLTRRGEQQARAAGIAIEHMAVAFDQVLYSPKVRARATAELAAEGWSERQRALLSEYPALAGGFDVPQAVEALAGVPAQDGRLLLVGHEPDLSQLIAGLTGARVDVKKGGIAVVRLTTEKEGPGPGSSAFGRLRHPLESGAGGELTVVMRPRELALIAGVPIDRAD
jgi:phosphohistidine phosphatase